MHVDNTLTEESLTKDTCFATKETLITEKVKSDHFFYSRHAHRRHHFSPSLCFQVSTHWSPRSLGNKGKDITRNIEKYVCRSC